jgi:8-oxo-dGTP pyrophosphatase MutT (NUDIX family)
MYSADEIRHRLLPMLDPTPPSVAPPDASLAAVLIPVLVAGGEPRLVLTKRSDTLSRHAGEISFPGGFAEPGEDLAATALRESQEEIGLRASEVELLGALPPLHTRVTGILIVPFVGLLHVNPIYVPNAAEIAEVLEFSLADLVAFGVEREFEFEGSMFKTHVYELDGRVIWGATAHILRSLIEALEPKGE